MTYCCLQAVNHALTCDNGTLLFADQYVKCERLCVLTVLHIVSAGYLSVILATVGEEIGEHNRSMTEPSG
jgi:hypothetical protein